MPTLHDAFISYSHSADGQLGPAIERALEGLARPLLRRRACDVFLDATSLAADPSLWGAIVGHLEGSRWFVLLASPASAASNYCRQEVQWWLQRHGTERLLVVVTAGDIAWDRAGNDFDWSRTTALPRELAGRFADEPLYVDLRGVPRDPPPTLRDAAFRSRMVDLAAPIRGLRKDELDAEDLHAHRRARRAAGAALALVLFGIGASVWLTLAKAGADRTALAQRWAGASADAAASRPDLALRHALAAQALRPDGTAALALAGALTQAPHLQRYVVPAGPAASHVTAVAVDGAAGLLVTAGCAGAAAADGCRTASLQWQPLLPQDTASPLPPQRVETGRIDDIVVATDGAGVAVFGEGGAWQVGRGASAPALLMRGRPVVAVAAGAASAPRLVAFADEAKIFQAGGRGIHPCTAFGLRPIARQGLALSPQGTHAAAADGRGNIEVVALQDCRRTRLRTLDSHGVLGFDASGRWLLAAMLDGTRYRWEVGSTQPLQPVGGDTALALAGAARERSPHALSAGGAVLALADGRQIRVHRFAAPGVPAADAPIAERWAAQAERLTLSGHGAAVVRTQLSADGRWLLSTDADNVTALWRLDRGQPLMDGLHEEWPAEDPRVAALPSAWQPQSAARPDGLVATLVEQTDPRSEGDSPTVRWRLVLTSAGSGAAEVVRVVLAQGLAVMDRPAGLQFGADGSLLVRRESGEVMAWRLRTAELLRRACAAAGGAPASDEVYAGQSGPVRWFGPRTEDVCAPGAGR